jgi:hypothetical protein
MAGLSPTAANNGTEAGAVCGNAVVGTKQNAAHSVAAFRRTMNFLMTTLCIK